MSSGAKQIAGALVGGAIGFVLGGGPMGAVMGASIGMGLMAVSSGLKNTGPRLDELKVQRSSYGDPLKKIFGASRVSGSLIWMSEVAETKNTESAGGKGGGGGGSSTTYSYSASVAIAICAGELKSISKIWADTNLVYDPSTGVSEDFVLRIGNAASSSDATVVRFFNGEEDQEACSFLRQIDPDQPAYRGTAYVVIEDLDLTPYGNRVPNFSFLTLKAQPPIITFTEEYDYAERVDWTGTPNQNSLATRWSGYNGVVYDLKQEAIDSYTSLLVGNAQYKYVEQFDYFLGWSDFNAALPERLYPDAVYDHVPYSTNDYSVQTQLSFIYAGLNPDVYLTPRTPADDSLYEGDGCVPDIMRPYGKQSWAHGDWVYSYVPHIYVGVYGGTPWPNYTNPFVNMPWVYLSNYCKLQPPAFDPAGRAFDVLFLSDQAIINQYLKFIPPATSGDEDTNPCIDTVRSVTEVLGTFRSMSFPRQTAAVSVKGIGPVIKSDDLRWSDQDYWEAQHLSICQTFNANELPPNFCNWVYGPSTDPYSEFYPKTIVKSQLDGPEVERIYLVASTVTDYCGGAEVEDAVSLSVIISDLMIAGGYEASEFDTTAVAGLITGYVIDRTMSIKNAIEPLLTLFAIDAIDNGQKIIFRSLGNGATLAIDENSIGTEGEDDPVEILTTQDFELPREIVLSYLNPNVDFQKNTQAATKDVLSTSVIANVEVPVGMGDSTAAQTIVRWRYTAITRSSADLFCRCYF